MAIPTRQLLSQTSYDTDGVTTVWNFSFSDDYIDRDYVKVQLLDKLTGVVTQHPITEANFLGDFQLSLTPAFPTGSELTIYRDTPKDAPLVNFADTASLTEISLDTNARQAVHIAAESSDGLATAIDSVSEIANLVQNASDFADAAEASAIAADASADAATTNGAAQVALAAAQVALATTQANNAAASASAANNSAIAADASADAAAASAASIAGGPVASVAGFTDIVTAEELRTGLGITAFGQSLEAAADAPAARTLLGLNGPLAYRNLFFNGGMECNIAVQGASTVTATYFVDGVLTDNTTTARLTSQQESTSLFPGYRFCLLSTVTTAGAPAANDFHTHSIPLEGTFTRKLGFGAAGASSIVLQFLVRASITGTFTVSVRNAATNRSYVTTFTVDAANTNELKTIVIPGDTSGTWVTTAARSMFVTIGMAVGTTFQTGTLNAWQAGNFVGATGQTQLTSTNGATFRVTAVDISAGTTVLPPEVLPLDMTLVRAKRYFEMTYPYGVPAGTGTVAGQHRFAFFDSSNILGLAPTCHVEKMATPASSPYNPSTGALNQVRGTSTGAGIAINGMDVHAWGINLINSAALFTNQFYDAQFVFHCRI